MTRETKIKYETREARNDEQRYNPNGAEAYTEHKQNVRDCIRIKCTHILEAKFAEKNCTLDSS